MANRTWVRLTVVLVVVSMPGSALAGAANAGFQCEGTGQHRDVRLEGSIPGDFSEFQLTLRHGDAEAEYSDRQSGQEIFVLKNFQRRVFSFVVRLPEGNSIELYGLPRGFRAQVRRNRTDAHFRAVLNLAPDPANSVETGGYLRNIPLRCNYDYSI